MGFTFTILIAIHLPLLWCYIGAKLALQGNRLTPQAKWFCFVLQGKLVMVLHAFCAQPSCAWFCLLAPNQGFLAPFRGNVVLHQAPG